MRSRSVDKMSHSGESIRVNPYSADTSRSRGTNTTSGSHARTLGGGGSLRVVKSGSSIGACRMNACHSGPFKSISEGPSSSPASSSSARRRMANHTASTPYGSTSGQQARLGRSFLPSCSGTAASMLSCGQFAATC